MRSRELDEFGPWIMEIKNKSDMPPLFEPYYSEDDTYLLLIKIPRLDIERRQVLPGMNLYDYVIGAYEDYLFILKREGETVSTVKIPYETIEVIQNYKDFLAGDLKLFFSEGAQEIEYNAISDEFIIRLIDIMRVRYSKKVQKTINLIDYDVVKEKLNFLFVNLLNQIKDNEGQLNILALQNETEVTAIKEVATQKLWYKAKSSSLQSELHLANEKELILIAQSTPFKSHGELVCGYYFTYIPFEKIKKVELRASVNYESVEEMIISTQHHQFSMYFESKNTYKENYLKALLNITG